MKTVLTIAGSDSSSRAGIQVDLRTLTAHGVHGVSAVTAITAQNTLGVNLVHSLPASIVTAQIEAAARHTSIDAAKTGMLATPAIVEAVAAAIDTFEIRRVVVDPVMTATTGESLLDKKAVDILKTELLNRTYVVTPNIPEAEILANMSINSLSDVRDAAQRIHSLGPTAVIIKGGHLSEPEIIDTLYDGFEFVEVRTCRVNSPNTRGTGCAFGSAIAANLALEVDLRRAIRLAQVHVTRIIQSRDRISHNPDLLNHS